MTFVADQERVRLLKAELDAMRPVSTAALARIDAHYDIELTYTSNAIEGNTLTAVETALVIEKGITVSGKRLRDHLEALDHYEAVRWIRALAGGDGPIDETTVADLHGRIVYRSQPEIAGRYAEAPRRVLGSQAVFPNWRKIPELMADFGAWLSTQPSTPQTAFEAHYRLVAIHPFADGNGRTARLLMNLVLLRAGYPAASVRPEDRAEYLTALEERTVNGDAAGYEALMWRRLGDVLAEYVATVRDER